MPQIEQAKGAVMVIYGLTEDAAFALLRWHSQQRNVPIRDIAAGLTTQEEPEPMGMEATAKLTSLLETVGLAPPTLTHPRPSRRGPH